MDNGEIESVGSAVTVIPAVIIDSFMVTHSIIITLIVTVSVLAVALPGVRELAAVWRPSKIFEAVFHGDACPAAYLIAERTGGAMSFDRSEVAERWSQGKRLGRPCPRLGQTRGPTWRPS